MTPSPYEISPGVNMPVVSKHAPSAVTQLSRAPRTLNKRCSNLAGRVMRFSNFTGPVGSGGFQTSLGRVGSSLDISKLPRV